MKLFRKLVCALVAVLSISTSAFGQQQGQIGRPKPPEPDIVGAGGEFTTSIDIRLPAYRDLPLQVSLNYNSSNTARGGIDNIVGFGWSLRAGSVIERKSLGGGVPTFKDGQDLFVLDGDELMSCNDTAATNKWTGFYPLRYRTDRASASCSAGGNFSTRVESYRRILYSPASNSFTVTRPDGTKLTYQSIATLEADASPAGTDQWKLANQTRWLLTEIRDAQATPNFVRYTYDIARPTDGYAHRLSKIEYAGYRVEFHYRGYSSRSVMVPRFATGTSLQGRQDSQLRSIRIFDGDLQIRAYQVSHSDAGISKMQLVTMVKEYASDFVTVTDNPDIIGGSSFLPTRFEYSSANWSLTELNAGNTPALADKAFHVGAAILDWDNNGTDDIWFQGATLYREVYDRDRYSMVSYGTLTPSIFRMRTDRNLMPNPPQVNSTCGYFVRGNDINTIGRGFVQQPAEFSQPQLLGNDRKSGKHFCLQYYTYNYLYGSNDIPAVYFSLGANIIDSVSPSDLQGRSLPEYQIPNTPYPPQVEALGNFDLDPDTEIQFGGMMYDIAEGKFIQYEIPTGNAPIGSIYGFYIFDINGDGVDDGAGYGANYFTIPEQGYVDGVIKQRSSWHTVAAPASTSPTIQDIHLLISLGKDYSFLGSTYVGFSDMNGDGLNDVVKLFSGWRADDFIVYHPSLGNSFGPPVIVPFPDVSGITEAIYSAMLPNGDLPPSRPQLSIRDVNGDGLPDIVGNLRYAPRGFAGYTTVSTTSDIWVFLNSGSEFVPQQPSAAQRRIITLIGSGDFDGDGLTDFALAGGPVVTSGIFPPDPDYSAKLLMGSGGLPSRMISVTNPNGGKISIAYTSSAEFGTNQMPGVQNVVKSITRDDGRGNTAATTYSYVGGKYDFINRRTLGYTTVSASLPAVAGEVVGPQVITIYMNDNIAEYGNVKSRTIVHSGVTQSQEINDYTTVVSGNGPWSSVRTRERQSVRYGADLIESTKLYSTSLYGQPLAVTALDLSGNGADIDSTDTVTESFGYTPNITDYIVDRPAFRQQQTGLAHTNDRTLWLSREAYFYDGAANYLGVAPTKGNLTRVSQWTGSLSSTSLRTTKSLTYDNYGNVKTEANALNATTTYEYDTAKNLFLERTTNPLGHITTATWNSGCQVPASQTDANGDKTSFSFDRVCREVRRDEPSGNYLITRYQSFGLPAEQHIQTETLSGSSASGETIKVNRIYFDGFGRTYKEVAPGATASPTDDIAVLSAYDQRGNLAWKSLPLPASASSASPAQMTTFSYDPLDRPQTTTHPDGHRTETKYSALTLQIMGAVLQKYPSVTQVNEDCFHITTATPCIEYVESFDGAGRRVSQVMYDRALTDVDAGGQIVRSTRYRYSPDGDLLEIRDPVGATWTYSYDIYGNRITANDPGLGQWTMTYDAANRLTSQTDSKTQTISFLYDSLDRPTRKTVTGGVDGTQVTTMGYDRVSTGFSNIGRLTDLSRGDNIIQYETYKNGQVAREVHTIGTRTFTIARNFRTAGQINNQHLPNQPGGQGGAMVGQFQYDNSGRVISLAREGAVNKLIDSITYNDWSQPLAVNYGTGAKDIYEYSPTRGFVTRTLSQDSAAASVADAIYYRNGSGRIRRINDLFGGADLDFLYDYSGRLLSATNYQGNAGYNQSFTYDAGGRMRSNSRVGSYGYTAANPVHAPSTITPYGGTPANLNYDPNGNMTTGLDGKVMTYDGENRPLSVCFAGKQTTYLYGADGKRLMQAIGPDTRTTQNDPCPIATGINVPIPSGTTFSFTVYFGGVEIRNWGQGTAEEVITYPHPNVMLKNGVPSVMHFDQLGSVKAVTGADGKKDEQVFYRPFGEPVEFDHDPTTSDQRKRFLGEQFDKEAGLSYLNARYYDPKLALFIQPDWFEVAKQGVGPNRYAYSHNDPINKMDPGGNESKPGIVERFADSIVKSFQKTVRDLKDRYSHGGSFSDRLTRAATQITPGAVSIQSAQRAYKSGDYVGAGIYASSSIAEVALSVGTLGQGAAAANLMKAGSKRTIVVAQETSRSLTISAGERVPFNEGIYEFLDGVARYVGQSQDLAKRLEQHMSSGRLAEGWSVTVTEVLGGKTMREIAEHLRVQQITGGVPARFSDMVTNVRDPIGTARRYLLK